MKNIGTHGSLPVIAVEDGADYYLIGSTAYAACGYGDVAFSSHIEWLSFGDWEVFFSRNGGINSLRNQKTGQWHGQSTGLQMIALVTDFFIDPSGLLPPGSSPAAYYGFRIETIVEYMVSKIPAFVPFQSQAQYARP
jgi:hypothetical protein